MCAIGLRNCTPTPGNPIPFVTLRCVAVPLPCVEIRSVALPSVAVRGEGVGSVWKKSAWRKREVAVALAFGFRPRLRGGSDAATAA